MGIKLTIGGYDFYPTELSVVEDVSPLAAGDTSGSVGTFTVTLPEPDPDVATDTSTGNGMLAAVGHNFLNEQPIEIFDSEHGFTRGTVVSTGITVFGAIRLTCVSRLGDLNIYNVQAQPYVGTLGGAFRYYLSLIGITADVVVDGFLESRPVSIVGWYGEIWYHLKMLCVAEEAEISLVDGDIVLRPIRQRFATQGREIRLSGESPPPTLAHAIEVYKYNTEPITETLVYPPGGWTPETEVLNVNAGETAEYTLELSASLSSIQTPTMEPDPDRNMEDSPAATGPAADATYQARWGWSRFFEGTGAGYGPTPTLETMARFWSGESGSFDGRGVDSYGNFDFPPLTTGEWVAGPVVKPGSTIAVSRFVRWHNFDTIVTLVIRFHNGTSWLTGPIDLASTPTDGARNTWHRVGGAIVVPAGATRFSLRAQLASGSTFSPSSAFDITGAQTELDGITPWRDGGITVDQFYGASSVYTVVANDGIEVSPAEWRDKGGRVDITINPDTTTLKVVLTGAVGVGIRGGAAASNFSLALGSNASGNRYSTLRIVGSGVMFKKEKKRIRTGVPLSKTATEVGVTIDNPFLSTTNQLYRAGIRAAIQYSGTQPTVSTEVLDVTAEGEPTYGNVAGVRFYDRRTRRYYRARSGTIGGTVTVAGDDDLTMGDVEEFHIGKTYAQVEAARVGLTYGVERLSGLR